MAKVKVSIIDPSTLRLEEDAKKGDLIDLHELQSVDATLILDAINKSKDETYNKLLKEEKERQEAKAHILLQDERAKFTEELNAKEQDKKRLLMQLDELKRSLAKERELAILEERNKKDKELRDIVFNKEKEIEALKHDIQALNEKTKFLVEAEKNALRQTLDKELSTKERELFTLKAEIERLKSSERETLLKLQLEKNNLLDQIKNKEALHKAELEKKEVELSFKFQEELKIKENELNQLRFAKSNLQIKMLGEELERWCNAEYESHAIVGFEDCKWYKDNKAVKELGEEKGTKADYIFEVYKDASKRPEDLLIRVVCEMKNESPDTKTKKKNADHYKKLNEDREKKQGHYALLISELEWDTVNDSPIKKVSEYDNMYMVRPSYFISFLALIKSLAKKYQSLLIEKHKESETFKTSQEILKEFNDFKNTYLDKPLTTLENEVKKIRSEAQKAYDASYNIIQLSDSIISERIVTIKKKIDTFDIKKIAKKVDKLED